MNYIRETNMTDVQYALTFQQKMDEMRNAESWSTQEDMLCTNIMEQFGATVENTFPKPMSLWPSGPRVWFVPSVGQYGTHNGF